MKKFLIGLAATLLFAGFLSGCGSSGGGDDLGGGSNDPVDITPPTVSYSVPVDKTTGVAINKDITATFDEKMRSTSLDVTTFKVTGPGSTVVAGKVTMAMDKTTAVFTPSSNLGLNTLYTAVITTAVVDEQGNALEENYAWTFTTASTMAEALADGPSPVLLGLASNFVILAKTGISTTGTTVVTGDIGVSPAARTYITGFSDALDASNQFSTSSLVSGKIYAANMAVPTPAKLTTAISNVETAYTDAAGRAIPTDVELSGGNIGGLTITPGLYKWSSSVAIFSDVTLSGGANDVWIFQIAEDLSITSGKAIVLMGGAQAKNIFWQVAGSVGLGTTSDFKGNIICQTKIVMSRGATLTGRAFAQTAVTMDANTVTPPTQ